MADLTVKKINTNQGPLPVDYTALANKPDLNNMFSNPNLLINSDFRNPVNQRGQNSYTGVGANTTTNVTYTIDRWAKRNYGSSVVKGEGHVRFKTENSNPTDDGSKIYAFVQSLENPEVFLGNTYTLSVKVKAVNGSFRIGIWQGSKTGFVSDLAATGVTGKDITSAGTYSVSFTIDKSFSPVKESPNTLYSVLNVGLVQFKEMFSEGSYIDVEWIKLEQGAIATPFVPRPYAEELMMCRRYYRNDLVRLVSYQHTNTNAYFGYSYEPMRVAPSFSYDGFDKTSNHTGVTANITEVALLDGKADSKDRITIKITFNDTNTAYYRHISGNIKLDAEIY